MSNEWFNIRFGDKHFHWEKHKRTPHITHNSYWENGHWRESGAGWFQVYTFFGFTF